MALVVYIILQRRVRLALEKENEPLKLAGDKKSFEPTGNKILIIYFKIYFKEGGSVKRFLPERYLELSRVLSMIGFDLSIFTEPRAS
ncbi:MAG: hypothetical protein HPY70_05370 [Firmicutes bacterium]|jgi:hypothetical protein|nr:hypothetical protein [Bacillota bacterium]